MLALICFVLAVLGLLFKSSGRLEAGNVALRHQVMVLRRQDRGRVHPRVAFPVPRPQIETFFSFRIGLECIAVPFRHIPPGQFDVDLLKAMQAAYDGVCKELGIDGSNPSVSARCMGTDGIRSNGYVIARCDLDTLSPSSSAVHVGR
jgi:hypothetical protein